MKFLQGIPQGDIRESWLRHDREMSPYVWGHRSLSMGFRVIGIYFLISLFIEDRAQVLEKWASGVTTHPLLQLFLFFGLLTFVWEILSMPFAVCHHFLERSYGLSKQSYISWLWDVLKGLLLGAVLGMIALSLLSLAQFLSVSFWWALSAFFLALFSIILAQLTPVLLIPLFFKLKPMEEGELKTRLLNLCKNFGIDVKEVYHLGLGAKTEKGNAVFTGLGKTKRILIGDTLYERYSGEVVEAVFAHELGHQVHHDLWRGIGLSVLLVFSSFFLAWWFCDSVLLPHQHAQFVSPFGMLLFFLTYSIIQYPLGWVQLAWSRVRERKADQFAADILGAGNALAEALEKLTFQNYSFFHPHPFLEWLTYSHPAPWRRIIALRQE